MKSLNLVAFSYENASGVSLSVKATEYELTNGKLVYRVRVINGVLETLAAPERKAIAIALAEDAITSFMRELLAR